MNTCILRFETRELKQFRNQKLFILKSLWQMHKYSNKASQILRKYHLTRSNMAASRLQAKPAMIYLLLSDKYSFLIVRKHISASFILSSRKILSTLSLNILWHYKSRLYCLSGPWPHLESDCVLKSRHGFPRLQDSNSFSARTDFISNTRACRLGNIWK